MLRGKNFCNSIGFGLEWGLSPYENLWILFLGKGNPPVLALLGY
jgi:hypothetical protein